MESTPPPVPAPSSPPPPVPPAPSTDNSLAVVMQLLGFVAFVFPAYGNVLAPLILWLIKRGDSPYLDRVGKEVLNFQISFSIYMTVAIAVGSILLIVLVGILFFLLAAAIWVAWIVLMIVAAVKTSNGEEYRYPLTIRLLQ